MAVAFSQARRTADHRESSQRRADLSLPTKPSLNDLGFLYTERGSGLLTSSSPKGRLLILIPCYRLFRFHLYDSFSACFGGHDVRYATLLAYGIWLLVPWQIRFHLPSLLFVFLRNLLHLPVVFGLGLGIPSRHPSTSLRRVFRFNGHHRLATAKIRKFNYNKTQRFYRWVSSLLALRPLLQTIQNPESLYTLTEMQLLGRRRCLVRRYVKRHDA